MEIIKDGEKGQSININNINGCYIEGGRELDILCICCVNYSVRVVNVNF